MDFSHDHPLILLDLNVALTTTFRHPMQRRSMATYVEQHEEYRGWLVDLLDEANLTTVLVTHRHERWQEPTLARIQQQIRWTPAESYFRDEGHAHQDPPEWKQGVWERRIQFEFGVEPGQCLAIESNSNTRGAYAEIGVPSIDCARGDEVWDSLPLGHRSTAWRRYRPNRGRRAS